MPLKAAGRSPQRGESHCRGRCEGDSPVGHKSCLLRQGVRCGPCGRRGDMRRHRGHRAHKAQLAGARDDVGAAPHETESPAAVLSPVPSVPPERLREDAESHEPPIYRRGVPCPDRAHTEHLPRLLLYHRCNGGISAGDRRGSRRVRGLCAPRWLCEGPRFQIFAEKGHKSRQNERTGARERQDPALAGDDSRRRGKARGVPPRTGGKNCPRTL